MEPQQTPGGRSPSHVRIFVVDQCKLAAPLFKRHLKTVDGIPASFDRLRQRLCWPIGCRLGRRSRTSQAAFGDTRRNPASGGGGWTQRSPGCIRWCFNSRLLRIAADPKAAALVPLLFCCVLHWLPLQCAIQSAGSFDLFTLSLDSFQNFL